MSRLPQKTSAVYGVPASGLSEIYAQALMEGLISPNMSLEEFAEITRANRQNPPRTNTHGSVDYLEEQRQSRFSIAKLFGRKK